jgi:hypothetical protein
MKLNLTEAQKKPTLTSDGRPWCQVCLYCSKQINFLKDIPESFIRLGEYVRHRKCLPPPAK